MRERIAAGKLFTDQCEGLPEDRLDGKLKMWAINTLSPDELNRKDKLMRETFNITGNVSIEAPLSFCYGYNIKIGDQSYINTNCTLIDDGVISIGERVLIGPAVTIATVSHPVQPDYRSYMYTNSVTLENGCWIGAGVTICPGVTIGENSVIGAGSVVVKDIPANTIAVGNPCQPIRKITEEDQRFYSKDHPITDADLAEERRLSRNR